MFPSPRMIEAVLAEAADPEDAARRLDRIRAADVSAAARRWLRRDARVVMVVDPRAEDRN